MQKKISNPYEYLDYRVLLNDDFLARTTKSHGYSLRAYARDLQLSPGFLSDLLRGKKEISPSGGRQVFSKLGFDEEETTYIENLITYRCGVDQNERDNSYCYIQSRHSRIDFVDDTSQRGFMRTIEHFIVYGVVRRLTNLDQIRSLTKQLSIQDDRVSEILQDLIDDNCVVVHGDEYVALNDKLVVRDDPKLLELIREYSAFIGRFMQDQGGIRVPDRVAHALIVAMDEESFEQAVAIHKHYIQQLHRLGINSKNPTRFIFISDFFQSLGI